MNEKLPQHDDHRFDRLVDGELSPAEYQALLASLDDEPGGWRRCALTFLEAQALERELGSLRRERVLPTVSPAVHAPTVARRVGYPLMALAMAASFLVAFGLGMAIRHDWSPAGGANTPQVAENDPQPNSPTNNNTAIAQNETRGNQPLGNVTLVVDGKEPSQQQRVEVPVYNYDQVAPDYFTIDQSALTPEMREMLQRNGHEVRSNRQLVPLPFGNGQQAVFPMEELEIVPVRMPAF